MPDDYRVALLNKYEYESVQESDYRYEGAIYHAESFVQRVHSVSTME